MILVDTSAWVEFLRDTGSPVCEMVAGRLDGELATTDAIRMELLAGARNESHLADLRGLLARATHLAIQASDYDTAALFYRQCRINGDTVRRVIDCLIGAVAARAGVSILHNDRDFELLARHTAVSVVAAG